MTKDSYLDAVFGGISEYYQAASSRRPAHGVRLACAALPGRSRLLPPSPRRAEPSTLAASHAQPLASHLPHRPQTSKCACCCPSTGGRAQKRLWTRRAWRWR